MKSFVILALTIFLLKTSSAQISKNNFFVGGSALFSSKTNDRTLFDVVDSALRRRFTQTYISVNSRYFISDRFGLGIKLLFATSKSRFLNTAETHPYTSTTFGMGPLMRYYFLPKKNRFNLLIEGSYQYGTEKSKAQLFINNQPVSSVTTKYTRHTFSFTGGPVVYINSIVGFELLFGYTLSKYADSRRNINRPVAGLGFQVTL